MDQPVITVITVVRNMRSVIGRCIDSVLAQKIDGLEYIIIDGASTDGTLDVIRSYGAAITKVVSEPDRSLYDAMNKGLRLARGKYIHILNADDHYVASDTLEKLLPQLEEDKACYGQMIYQDERGNQRELCGPYSWEKEIVASRIPQPTFIAPKALYDQVGEFDINYKIAADYDLILRMCERFPVKFIPQPVTMMHTGGLSYRQMKLSFKEAAVVSQRHGRSFLASRLTYCKRMLKWQIARQLPPEWILAFRRL